MIQPYMYTYAGAAHKGEEKIMHLGQNDYNHTAGGLSGVSRLDIVDSKLKAAE